jgi:hypothetical protein
MGGLFSSHTGTDTCGNFEKTKKVVCDEYTYEHGVILWAETRGGVLLSLLNSDIEYRRDIYQPGCS